MSLGVDIEEVRRFQTLIRNPRFLKRVFTPQEIRYCSTKKNKAQHFAVRFAAKEAVWKALSQAIRSGKKGVAHNDIGIKNDSFGKPQVFLPKALARFQKKIEVSLSHTDQYAVAVAVVSD